jgi:hypothetical protein
LPDELEELVEDDDDDDELVDDEELDEDNSPLSSCFRLSFCCFSSK